MLLGLFQELYLAFQILSEQYQVNYYLNYFIILYDNFYNDYNIGIISPYLASVLTAHVR
jgi:hypothetical protein